MAIKRRSNFTFGPHRVRHGDVADPKLEKWLGDTKATVFYTDPPWGDGLLKYFDTVNKRDNSESEYLGPPKLMTMDPFLDRVIGLAKEYTNGWVVIEFGKRWTELVKQIAEAKGLHYCGEVEALYGKNLPLDILFYRTDWPIELDWTPVYHLKGYKCVRKIFEILKPNKGGVGMDLCCGLGYTAQACIDNGMSFVGNELNMHRLKRTIQRLEKATQ